MRQSYLDADYNGVGVLMKQSMSLNSNLVLRLYYNSKLQA